AGGDYGPSAEAWRAWWRDPPRPFLGLFRVGHTTLVAAMPAVVVAAAFFLWGVGRRRGGPALSWGFAWIVFVCAWFLTFVALASQLVGGPETCRFGQETITYHANH